MDEGNASFREGDWRQATQQYGEGISVARYAQAEALVIPHELLESLYVNRAAAFYQTVREKGKCLVDVHVMSIGSPSLSKKPLSARVCPKMYGWSLFICTFLNIEMKGLHSLCALALVQVRK